VDSAPQNPGASAAVVLGTAGAAELAPSSLRLPRQPKIPVALLASFLPLVLLGLGFTLEKGLALALEIFLAAEWGTSPRRDMYLVASTVLVSTALIELTFLPLIVDARRRGTSERGDDLVASLPAAALLLIVVVTILATAVWLMGGGTTAVPAAEMAGALLAFVAAAVGLAALSIAAGHQIADRRFVLASLRLAVVSAGQLGAAVLLPFGVAAPALGAAVSASALAVVFWMRSEAGKWFRRPRLLGLWAALGLFAMNAYPVVPRLLIERPVLGAMGNGTLATLDFAEKTTVIIGLAGFAIVGVVTTALSGDRSTYRSRALFVVALLALPALATALLAEPIVRVLFERGLFSAADTRAVAGLARLLAPSIPFVAALPLLVPGVQAAGHSRRGAALIGLALLVHLAVALWTHRSGDPHPLTLSFDAGYLLLFGGFYALARTPQRESQCC
jgi:putative peptidoglycan lipid II flippase